MDRDSGVAGADMRLDRDDCLNDLNPNIGLKMSKSENMDDCRRKNDLTDFMSTVGSLLLKSVLELPLNALASNGRIHTISRVLLPVDL